MKKFLLPLLVFLILLSTVSIVYADKGRGKGKGTGKHAANAARVKKAVAENAEIAADPNLESKGKSAKGRLKKDARPSKEKAKGKSKGKGKGKAVSQEVDEQKAKGKGHQKQLAAVESKLQREQAKHLNRTARLNRLRELAEEKGDPKILERVDKLIAKEQQRYERKIQKTEKIICRTVTTSTKRTQICLLLFFHISI